MSEQQRLYIGGDNEMMRISLIASLIVLLMAIPASHSQSDYPRLFGKATSNGPFNSAGL